MAEYEEDVRQAILIILDTEPGERVMRPDFGAGLRALVFESINTNTLALARHRVEQALVLWEPRIDSIDVSGDRRSAARSRHARDPLPDPRHQHVLQPGLSVLRPGRAAAR